jgi:hypothetical protein
MGQAAIANIPEHAWQTLPHYPEYGEAQIAEGVANGHRLIARHTRLIGPQTELWPDWRHFAFTTNRTELLRTRRGRAPRPRRCRVRDPRPQGPGNGALPVRKFNANAAWTVIGCIAHNLLRWTP